MAKILLGAGIIGASGSLAGMTFSRNANGAYIRARATPVNPRTEWQLPVRAVFGQLSSGYKNLSEGNRSAWRDAAANFPYQDTLGQTKQYTANQLYMKLNMNLLVVNSPLLTAPPVPQVVLNATASSAIVDYTDPQAITFELDNLFVPNGHKAVIQATAPMSDGKKWTRSDFKLIRIVDSQVATPTSIKIGYESRFGVIDYESDPWFYVSIHTVNLASGQVSPMTVFRVIF